MRQFFLPGPKKTFAAAEKLLSVMRKVSRTISILSEYSINSLCLQGANSALGLRDYALVELICTFRGASLVQVIARLSTVPGL